MFDITESLPSSDRQVQLLSSKCHSRRHKYCQCRLNEVPIGALNPPGKSKGATFYIKTDKIFDVPVDDICVIESELTRILTKPVYLRGVECGCIKLVFYILHELDYIFPLNEKQKYQLKEIGVLRVYNKHKEYYSLSKGINNGLVLFQFSHLHCTCYVCRHT